jgi:hypothetical protein
MGRVAIAAIDRDAEPHGQGAFERRYVEARHMRCRGLRNRIAESGAQSRSRQDLGRQRFVGASHASASATAAGAEAFQP